MLIFEPQMKYNLSMKRVKSSELEELGVFQWSFRKESASNQKKYREIHAKDNQQKLPKTQHRNDRLKRLVSQYSKLQEQYQSTIQELKQKTYEYDSQTKEIQRLKSANSQNKKEIKRLNSMISLIKKKDISTQVNFDQREDRNGETMSPECMDSRTKTFLSGFATNYSSNHHENEEYQISQTLQRIEKKKQIFEKYRQPTLKYAKRIKGGTENRITNSPYSRFHIHM